MTHSFVCGPNTSSTMRARNRWAGHFVAVEPHSAAGVGWLQFAHTVTVFLFECLANAFIATAAVARESDGLPSCGLGEQHLIAVADDRPWLILAFGIIHVPEVFRDE
jgi:hypothetical protein